MKILYLTLESYLNQAIIQSQVINLFKAINAHNKKTERFPQLYVDLITFDHSEAHFEHPDLPIIRHFSFKDKGMLRNILFLCRNGKRLFVNTDIIHVRSYLPMIPALLGKWLYKKKVVFDMRGVLPEETYLRKKNALLFQLLRSLERVACRYADKVVVVSTSFREIILQRTKVKPENISVIPTFSANSVKKELTEKAVTDLRKDIFHLTEGPIFVYSGAFEKWQCAQEVVSFFKVLNNKIPTARFLILTKHITAFSTLLQQYLPTGLYYVNNVNNDELQDYLCQCDYGILFREKHIINQVAAPIKFKDYLSAGIPVIITDGIGDYSRYVSENNLGFILPALSILNYEMLADKICNHQVSFNKEDIRKAANSLFDVGKAAENYMNLYDTLKLK